MYCVLMFASTLLAGDNTSKVVHAKIGDVIMQPDTAVAEYKIDGHESSFIQSVQMGGFFQLQIIRQDIVLIEVDDVNGIVPIGNEKYIYAVGSIYGNRPGLYLFDAATKREVVLRKAENVTRGYPNGADYYELAKCVIADHVINYYFTEDPDKTDFSNFRTKYYLKSLNISNDYK
jgi:hypothetical protein